MADLKISLRKRGSTNFETGDRLLPVTHYNYVEGLIGPDGKINPGLIPAWLYNNRVPVGIIDLDPQGPTNIDNVIKDPNAFKIDPLRATSELLVEQGHFVEVTTPGQLTNAGDNADLYELVGGGHVTNKDFPVNLDTGDYIMIVKVNDTNPKFSIAIVDNVYGDATVNNKGIVKLYNGVNSESTTLAATAASVKQAHDLAYTKENAFSKNSAFNKQFTPEGDLNGNTDTVARGDHRHGDYSRDEDKLVSLHVIDDIKVSNGIVTGISTRHISQAEIAMTMFDDGVGSNIVAWSGDYLKTRFEAAETNTSAAIKLAKKGIEFYNTVEAADEGSHLTGDIVIVQGA